MSIRVMCWVWDSSLPPIDRLVALAYADHADHDGHHIYPSRETIARKTGLDIRTISRVRERLIRQGVLVPVRMSKGGRPSEFSMSNEALNRGAVPLSDPDSTGAPSPLNRGTQSLSTGALDVSNRGTVPLEPSVTVKKNRQGTERGRVSKGDDVLAEQARSALDSPSVRLWRSKVRMPLSPEAAIAIFKAIHDLDQWGDVLDFWLQNPGWRRDNVPAQLQRYASWGTRQTTATYAAPAGARDADSNMAKIARVVGQEVLDGLA